MITYIKGSIFDTSADAIAHGVNCEGIMNGGLAKQIRDRYTKMYYEYRSLCVAGFALPGELMFYYSHDKTPT